MEGWRVRSKLTSDRRSFVGWILPKVNLFGAEIRTTDFSRARMWRADLSMAQVRDSFFVETNLSKATCNSATFTGVNLERAKLADARLFEARFERVILSGADCSRLNAFSAGFVDVNMDGVILDDATLHDAEFRGVTLRGASLRNALLAGTSFQDVDLTGANLQGAKLSTRAIQYSGASFDASTAWPTDPELLVGATMDGLPFGEAVAELGSRFTPAQFSAWSAMRAARMTRAAFDMGGGTAGRSVD